MKKQWIRCLAAVSLIVTIGTGAGTVLKAHGILDHRDYDLQ